jgi:hypothetical protein
MGHAERTASEVWEETLLRMRACFNFDQPRRENKDPPAHSRRELRSGALNNLAAAARSSPREQVGNSNQ